MESSPGTRTPTPIIGVDASRALRSPQTGTERYSLRIIRHLLALACADPARVPYRWRLYTEGPTSLQPFLDPTLWPAPLQPPQGAVEICSLPARRLWTHGALARELLRRPPDLLFVPAHVLPFPTVCHLPASLATIHDLGHRYYPQAHTGSQRLYLELSTRWNAHAATRVIAASYATARDLTRFYATPSTKMRVIHEAADPPRPVSPHERAAVRARYGLTQPFALFVGTLQPRKNLDRLIQAYARLCGAGGPGWQLVLAGAVGWLSQPLQQLVDELGVAKSVRFLGYVPDGELPALLTAAHLFCFPSLFEGFGLPILEAQSYGVPVMTSHHSALPEVAGDAALLVDPTDVDAIAAAMLRLSQDEPLRQRLIAAGHANVARFSWPKAAAETLAVMAEAMRSRT